MNNNNKTSLFESLYKNIKLNYDPIKDGDFEIRLYLELHDKLKFTIETEFNELNVEIDEIQKM